MRPIPFDVKSKKKWDRKNKSNPLNGKGKSYADRVEGHDGWGQYVRPENDDGLTIEDILGN